MGAVDAAARVAALEERKGSKVDQDILRNPNLERWADVVRHVTADIHKTRGLAERLGFFRAVEAAVL